MAVEMYDLYNSYDIDDVYVYRSVVNTYPTTYICCSVLQCVAVRYDLYDIDDVYVYRSDVNTYRTTCICCSVLQCVAVSYDLYDVDDMYACIAVT